MSGAQYLFIVQPCLLLLVIAGALLTHAIVYYRRRFRRKALARFVRFFSTFAHIGTLVLRNVMCECFVFEAVIKALKGVKISRLEVTKASVDYHDWFVIKIRK